MSVLRALLAIPVVVALVLLGLWVTGGLLTNDFALARALSAAWMGLAGLASLAVGVRFRAVRWPVIGAYVVTAAVAGAYLGSSVVLDDEVNEMVAMAAPAPPPASAAAPPRAARRPAQPVNRLLREGRLRSVRHPARGQATLIRLASGRRVLTLTRFEVDNGPDLRVYLVAGRARNEGEVRDWIDLGALKGNKGDQQYRIGDEVDVGHHSTVVIWCRAFSVLFARAPTRA